MQMRIGSRWTRRSRFIRNYIEIEKLRHQVDMPADGGKGRTEGLMIETLSLYIFIENGFKHAMDHTSGSLFLYYPAGHQRAYVLKRYSKHHADLESRPRR